MKKIVKRTFQIAISLGVSAFFVYLSLRDVELREVGQALVQADLRYMGLYLVILLVIHLLRTLRWGLLLEPLGQVSFSQLNTASGVGFMALIVLPLRLGEFARSYVIKRLAKIRMSASMATVVVERVIDMLFIALLIVVTLFGVQAGGARVGYLRTAGMLLFAIFAAVLWGLVLAYRHRERAVRLVGWFLHPVSARLAHRVGGLLDSFINGLRVVPDARRVIAFFGLTAAYWGVNALGLMVLARAFGFQLGPHDAATVLGVQVVGVMIPAGPGMLGTFQFFTMFGLSLFVPGEVMRVQGAAYAHALWAMNFGQQVALGLILLSASHLGIRAVMSGSEEAEEEVEREGAVAEHGAPGEAGALPREPGEEPAAVQEKAAAR